MTLAETIYQHSLSLPEPAAREVLDFNGYDISKLITLR